MGFWQGMTVQQRTHFVVAVLGAEHDLSKYGESFFTTAHLAIVGYVLKRYPAITNWRQLRRALIDVMRTRPPEIHPELLRHGGQVLGATERMCELEILNATAAPSGSPDFLRDEIDVTDLFTRQEVHFYHLPVSRGSEFARSLGHLIARALIAAAENTARRRQMFLIIDEFQALSSGVLSNFLSQSRSLNIGVILANQFPAQITDKVILGNLIDGARFRQWFGLGLETQEWFSRHSGQRIDHLNSWTISDGPTGRTVSQSIQELLLPHFSVNDLKRITADPALSIYELVRGTLEVPSTGFPEVVQSFYTISKGEYERRKLAGWPDGSATIRQRPLEIAGPDEFPARPDSFEDY